MTDRRLFILGILLVASSLCLASLVEGQTQETDSEDAEQFQEEMESLEEGIQTVLFLVGIFLMLLGVAILMLGIMAGTAGKDPTAIRKGGGAMVTIIGMIILGVGVFVTFMLPSMIGFGA